MAASLVRVDFAAGDGRKKTAAFRRAPSVLPDISPTRGEIGSFTPAATSATFL
jgi:hypothetical protein